MKYSIIILTALLSFSFLGCSTHSLPKQASKSSLKREKVKQSVPKVQKSSPKLTSPHKQEKKIINDYKRTIYKNVAKSKDKEKKLAILKTKKEKLLKEMQKVQASYSETKDKTILNKKRAKITKELNRIQKEYEELNSKVVVVNYTQKKNKSKE